MSSLSQADWQKLLKVLQSLYEPYSLDEFPVRSLAALSKLAGAEIYGCVSSSLRDMVIPRHYTLPVVEVGMATESFTTLRQHFADETEAEVLFWVAKDESVKAVAKRLGMSDRTVKKHLEHVYEKFGVQTRLAAVMHALEKLGIVNP